MWRVLMLGLVLAQAADVPRPMATPSGWMATTARAEALAREGKALEAAAVYEQYSAKVPWFPAAHYLRVRLLLSAGRADLVPPALAAARAKVPRDAPMRPRSKDALTQKAAVLEAYAEHVETSASRRKALQSEANALRERAYGVR